MFAFKISGWYFFAKLRYCFFTAFKSALFGSSKIAKASSRLNSFLVLFKFERLAIDLYVISGIDYTPDYMYGGSKFYNNIYDWRDNTMDYTTIREYIKSVSKYKHNNAIIKNHTYK